MLLQWPTQNALNSVLMAPAKFWGAALAPAVAFKLVCAHKVLSTSPLQHRLQRWGSTLDSVPNCDSVAAPVSLRLKEPSLARNFRTRGAAGVSNAQPSPRGLPLTLCFRLAPILYLRSDLLLLAAPTALTNLKSQWPLCTVLKFHEPLLSGTHGYLNQQSRFSLALVPPRGPPFGGCAQPLTSI